MQNIQIADLPITVRSAAQFVKDCLPEGRGFATSQTVTHLLEIALESARSTKRTEDVDLVRDLDALLRFLQRRDAQLVWA